MAFFKRKVKDSTTLVNVEDVYLATTTIISSFLDSGGYGPVCLTYYFLVRLESDGYHELFSGIKIDESNDDEVAAHTDKPYIEQVEPMIKYLRDKSQKKISTDLLFHFIVNQNVSNHLKELDKKANKEKKE